VNRKEALCKEDPEFRFRMKPRPRAVPGVQVDKQAIAQKHKELAEDFDSNKKSTTWLIKAHDERIQRWDMLGLVAVVYTAVVTPFDVSFLEPKIDAVFFLNRTIDCYFIVDMIFQFFLMPQDKLGRYIKNQKKVAMLYLRSWFVIDFVSVLPFDIVGMVANSDDVSQLKVLRVIRVLRLIKPLRIMRVNRVFRRWENMYSINYSVFGLYCYIVFVFMSTHWFGCFYHLVAYVENGSNSWVIANTYVNDLPVGTFDVYIFSVHWATQTISSIGYGDVGPQTTAERTFVTFMMLVAGVIFAFALGEICGAVTSLSQKESYYQRTIDDFNKFAEEVSLSQETRKLVRIFFKHKHSHNTLKEDEVVEIMDKLTDHLRMEVALFIHTDWIKEVPFFQGCDETFIVYLAVSMVIRTFTPKEAIYMPGDEADSMYVVKSGMAASKGVIYGQLKVTCIVFPCSSRNRNLVDHRGHTAHSHSRSL